MALTNVAKPTTSETWSSISTTWANELHVWENQYFLCSSKPTTSLTNSAKTLGNLWSISTLPWQLSLPWQVTNDSFTNQSKP